MDDLPITAHNRMEEITTRRRAADLVIDTFPAAIEGKSTSGWNGEVCVTFALTELLQRGPKSLGVAFGDFIEVRDIFNREAEQRCNHRTLAIAKLPVGWVMSNQLVYWFHHFTPHSLAVRVRIAWRAM